MLMRLALLAGFLLGSGYCIAADNALSDAAPSASTMTSSTVPVSIGTVRVYETTAGGGKYLQGMIYRVEFVEDGMVCYYATSERLPSMNCYAKASGAKVSGAKALTSASAAKVGYYPASAGPVAR